jgi:mono/diheme cytochrome c family protein
MTSFQHKDSITQYLAILFGVLTLATTACTKKDADSSSSSDQSSAQGSGDASGANSMGVGPITSPVTIDSKVDLKMAAQGKTLFESRCNACHKFETKYVGPALNGVTKRRRPEWIMNMILNPGEMTQKDETAKALLAEHLTQMANQNLTKDEARAVLEYFRQNDAGK